MTDVRIERDVAIVLDDRVTLRADVYRPDDDGAHPTLLQYTAYNKSNWLSVFGVINPMRAVGSGFAVVVVDARGRFASGGDEPFAPFRADGDAAVAAIEWASSQPWSNGAVGMYGASNNGVPQWQAARRRPAALRTIAPHFTASEYDDGWVYRGGAFQLGFNAWWTAGNLAPDMLGRAARRGEDVGDAMTFLGAVQRDPSLVFDAPRDRPLGPIGDFVPYYDDWQRHAPGAAYWASTSLAKCWRDIDLPILHVAGWYNVHLDGNLANYRAIRTLGLPSARDRQYLVIGPWTQWQPAVGDACGPEQRYPTALMDMEGLQLAWFAEHLDGAAPVSRPRARVFVMGVDEWRDYEDWPPPASVDLEYLLQSNGAANGLAGDGLLSSVVECDVPHDSFVHDPSNPVPTLGGATMLPHYTATAGQRDQQPVEERADVLVYSTPPLTEPLTVVGHVRARVWVTSSAATTDVTAKLCDVHPDGRSMILCDGIVRVGAPGGAEGELDAERPRLLAIDVQATANVFGVGHRVRLEVASSNFPKFDLHARRAGPDAVPQTVTATARQRVWHDGEHASVLVLPVLPPTPG